MLIKLTFLTIEHVLEVITCLHKSAKLKIAD